MTIAAILFDFGGTLDADGGHWLDRTWALYERRGIAASREAIRDAFYTADRTLEGGRARSLLTLDAMLSEHFGIQLATLGHSSAADRDWLAREFGREMRESFARNLPHLERLAARHRLAILSNFYGNLAEICAEAGLDRHFRAIFDSAKEGLAKPDPRFFERALARLDVRPAEAMMVGDNLARDIAPARALGMTTVWMAEPGRTTLPGDPAPDRRVANLAEVVALLA